MADVAMAMSQAERVGREAVELGLAADKASKEVQKSGEDLKLEVLANSKKAEWLKAKEKAQELVLRATKLCGQFAARTPGMTSNGTDGQNTPKRIKENMAKLQGDGDGQTTHKGVDETEAGKSLLNRLLA